MGGVRGCAELVKEVNERYADLLKQGYDMGVMIFQRSGGRLARHLVDGEYAFELGGVEFRLILASGHIPSNVVVYLPQHRILFASDAAYSATARHQVRDT
ncbi:MAG: hypothetical protein DRJ96_07485 [Thermoprotei archaeon]|nr:MAG: hypothetical protein DRJ96_07485 [Thermoprotei archaeon]